MNVIETHALGESYGSTRALHDCTLAIPDRHVVALVGPNGAGNHSPRRTWESAGCHEEIIDIGGEPAVSGHWHHGPFGRKRI